jgi:hypothetical protein
LHFTNLPKKFMRQHKFFWQVCKVQKDSPPPPSFLLVVPMLFSALWLLLLLGSARISAGRSRVIRWPFAGHPRWPFAGHPLAVRGSSAGRFAGHPLAVSRVIRWPFAGHPLAVRGHPLNFFYLCFVACGNRPQFFD